MLTDDSKQTGRLTDDSKQTGRLTEKQINKLCFCPKQILFTPIPRGLGAVLHRREKPRLNEMAKIRFPRLKASAQLRFLARNVKLVPLLTLKIMKKMCFLCISPWHFAVYHCGRVFDKRNEIVHVLRRQRLLPTAGKVDRVGQD